MRPSEQGDFSPKKIWLSGASLLILLLLIGALLAFFQSDLLRHLPRESETAPASSPRSQVEFDRGDLAKALRERQLRDLNGYGWVDKEKGIVHIPIARAIEIYLRDHGRETKR